MGTDLGDVHSSDILLFVLIPTQTKLHTLLRKGNVCSVLESTESNFSTDLINILINYTIMHVFVKTQ